MNTQQQMRSNVVYPRLTGFCRGPRLTYFKIRQHFVRTKSWLEQGNVGCSAVSARFYGQNCAPKSKILANPGVHLLTWKTPQMSLSCLLSFSRLPCPNVMCSGSKHITKTQSFEKTFVFYSKTNSTSNTSVCVGSYMWCFGGKIWCFPAKNTHSMRAPTGSIARAKING